MVLTLAREIQAVPIILKTFSNKPVGISISNSSQVC